MEDEPMMRREAISDDDSAYHGLVQEQLPGTGQMPYLDQAHIPQPAGADLMTVQFSRAAYEALRRLAEGEGKTLSDFLRDAVRLEQFIRNVQRDHGRILIQRDGKFEEMNRLP